ncbi:hypothetical protein C0991_010142 [Blastosporella zonata]|nr:hypothetical protein C0991_010142 [Blastosporella zonata]
MRFSSFFTLASLVISSYGTTVATVEADIGTISTQLTTLDNAINAYSATIGVGTLLQALTIHSDAVTLGSTLDSTTTDVKCQAVATPISDADGQTILSLLLAFESTIDDALTKIAARQPAFAALPLGGVPALVKQDLSNLNASTNALETALIAVAPSVIQASSIALKTRINAAFATAIAAFA